MTFRITLLVLVTGLFAMIWTHDQNRPNRSVTASAKPRKLQQRTVVNSPVSRPVSIMQDVARQSAEIPMDDLWMFGGLEMPLPEGLVPGEYRVVDNTGTVRQLTLTLDDLTTYYQTVPNFITRDIYQSQDEHRRWYFIRVQSSQEVKFPVVAERGKHVEPPAVAERGKHSQHPVVAERNESWRREKVAGRIIVRAGRDLLQKLSTAAAIRRKIAGPFRRAGWIALEQTLRGMKSPFRLSSSDAEQLRF